MNDYAFLQAPDTLRFERVLPGPVERVWAFLTDPEKRRLWLAAGSIEPYPGGEIDLLFRHRELSDANKPTPERYAKYDKDIHVRGVVTRCEPPRVLAHTWDAGTEYESEVTFELTPQGDKVMLVVTHRRLADRANRLSVASGWHAHLTVLADRLKGRDVADFWPMFGALEDEYAARLP